MLQLFDYQVNLIHQKLLVWLYYLSTGVEIHMLEVAKHGDFLLDGSAVQHMERQIAKLHEYEQEPA
jgi:hypothetical protein